MAAPDLVMKWSGAEILLVALTVDRQPERHPSGEPALSRRRERMEARALNVAEQTLKTDPAEVGGAAGDLHRKLDGLERAAGDQRTVNEDRIGGLRRRCRGLAE